MASVDIYQTIQHRVETNQAMGPYEQRATNWFRTNQNQLHTWQKTHDHMSFDTLVQGTFTKRLIPPKNVLPGFLYLFMYLPADAADLPYYDRMPLVLTLKRTNSWFMGINLHYLPYRHRALLFDLIASTYRIEHKDPLKSYMHVNYRVLDSVAKYRAFRPCVRQYTYGKCRSALMQIGETDWDMAMFLPVDLFTKKNRADVWNDSIQSIQKG